MLTDAERSLVRRVSQMAEPKRGPESGTARPAPGQIKPNPASVPRPAGRDEMGRVLRS